MHTSRMGGDAPYWSQEASVLAETLGSGPGGLPSDRAAARLAEVGVNTIEEASRLSPLRLLLRQFESPLVLILAFAAGLSLTLREWTDAAIILTIVLGSALLSFFQEYRASAAVQALERRLALTARVVRDGVARNLPVSTIVPGDLIELSAGNLIPADGIVIEAEDFLVSEASMTGESFPVEKRPGIVREDATIAARSNSVFLGTSVRSGTAKVLAVRTGRRTEFGTVAERLRAHQPETDFERGIRHFGYLLLRVMIVIVLFVLTTNLMLGRPVIESLLFAVALAVGLSPELLPAILGVTLSAGARAMSKRGVIVRRLESIENFGSMDILCTDKTGTLTEGTIVLREVLDCASRPSVEVRRLAFLNSAFETGIENPIDAALVAAGAEAGLSTEGIRKIDEIPYDFLRRRLTIVVEAGDDPERHCLITKGAFANVLDVCAAMDLDGIDVPLDAERREALEAVYRAKGAEGDRVLALATRQVTAKEHHDREDERDMTFRGFLIFSDPPKEDVQKTLQALARLGIGVKIISGDNRYVTAHLAGEIGLNPASMLTGADLERLRDEALWHLAPRTDLFAEIDPQQKERIVRALQRAGHSVGYLGDGINDAPSLHAADVGISVEGAVDVARESADIILLNRDLDVLREGVEDGRRTFANTMKYISITTSANFGNMVSMAFASPLLPFLPLAAKQILLNNFLSDVPSITIASDNVDRELLERPQRWSVREIQRFMIIFGLISSAFDLLTFAVLLSIFHVGEATFQTSWFLISLLSELAVLLVLRTHRPLVQSRPCRVMLWSTVLVGLATVCVPYVSGLNTVFGFVPLPASLMGSVAAIVLGYILATEAVKRRYFRSHHIA
ncbi:magnesium-translocating P-type ATPase [Tautonia rosea]|uniref:magnesium-translocating P-type ATPase n=1 Tax=Tautonia rosea TaxID=2728037 RepID=UPI0019D08DA0|nr:magnesium-translocating P-type ATPase [Tautonia rosea]